MTEKKLVKRELGQLLFITIVVLLFLFSGGVEFVYAQQEYTLLEPLKNPAGGEVTATSDLGNYLQFAFQFIIGITGVLAVIMIILGGVRYISTDAISGKEEGRSMITGAIGGLLLAILSWLILNTINPKLLEFNVAPPSQSSGGGGGGGGGGGF